MKKILKIILIIAILFVAGIFTVLMFQMYKPVLDASKKMDEVDAYALSVTDKLVERDVKIILDETHAGGQKARRIKSPDHVAVFLVVKRFHVRRDPLDHPEIRAFDQLKRPTPSQRRKLGEKLVVHFVQHRARSNSWPAKK